MFRTFLAMLIPLCVLGSLVNGSDFSDAQNAESNSKVSVFEGVLKIHPKFLYKYYVVGFAEEQHFALFGEEKLKDIKPGSIIHVEGRLGTRLYPGGTKDNPSPFPRAWYVYMDVELVKVLREPEKPSGPTDPSSLPGVAAPSTTPPVR